ncbi:PREDICTED: E3 ubiquitin-protein ligase At1g12760-like [Lupinus angustifolius]|uniref:E3 ubiquitin-protein ligase At1g12760-like n=1 Tax=Lupinus angustifolius TaxID=3871 RepID=UPI00092FD1F7|nr:PREDICTED: E3 ubiquitin-protein ligase At1g12760-like [Lupinus angustifolius]
MATTGSPNHRTVDADIDPTPLLSSSGGSSDESNSSRRRQGLRQAARFLRQASGQRMMREPSMVVRETAAEQLEERQSDWAYSKPVVVLDILWNFAFVVAVATVLVLSVIETPIMPLRLWLVGYALQCVVHVVCVCVEFRRRRRNQREGSNNAAAVVQDGVGGSDLSSGSIEGSGSGQYGLLSQLDEEGTSMAKHLESANTMFSFIWWVIGFYWVSAGGQGLAQDSPLLYWLCIVFLGFDVFFVVFCIALACIIGIAVCCCLPCIIALLYAVADQDGASKEDIEQLSKFKFRRIENGEKLAGNTEGSAGGIMTECVVDSPIEHVLSDEDAECCICLSAYDDGIELRQLPCGHHFHCTCVDKWLYINATCPLCKYNILKSTSHGHEEV